MGSGVGQAIKSITQRRVPEWLPHASAIALLAVTLAALWTLTYGNLSAEQLSQGMTLKTHSDRLTAVGVTVTEHERRINSLEQLQQDVRENTQTLRQFMEQQKKH